MLIFFSIMVILAVGYAHHREGLFTALTMFVNIFLAGVLTFEVYEPLASTLENSFQGTVAWGSEDFLVLITLFSFFLTFLRWATNSLASSAYEIEPNLSRIGAALVGLFSGYLVAGFLACAFQTLPWHENFMSFTPRAPDEGGLRGFLPPDRAYLAILRHAGSHGLCWREIDPEASSNYDRYRTFDPYGTYEIRFLRYRRFNDGREAFPYQGEFDRELSGKRFDQ
jgi:hypothetical protein